MRSGPKASGTTRITPNHEKIWLEEVSCLRGQLLVQQQWLPTITTFKLFQISTSSGETRSIPTLHCPFRKAPSTNIFHMSGEGGPLKACLKTQFGVAVFVDWFVFCLVFMVDIQSHVPWVQWPISSIILKLLACTKPDVRVSQSVPLPRVIGSMVLISFLCWLKLMMPSLVVDIEPRHHTRLY